MLQDPTRQPAVEAGRFRSLAIKQGRTYFRLLSQQPRGMTGTRVSRFVVIRVARGAPARAAGGHRAPHHAQRYRPWAYAA